MVSTKIYDKTKEIREAGFHKPYIVENWRRAGYIDDVVNWICDNLDHEPGIVDIGRGEGMCITDACSTVAHVMKKIIYTRTFPPSDVDMKVSIASPGIPGITLEEGLRKMLSL